MVDRHPRGMVDDTADCAERPRRQQPPLRRQQCRPNLVQRLLNSAIDDLELLGQRDLVLGAQIAGLPAIQAAGIAVVQGDVDERDYQPVQRLRGVNALIIKIRRVDQLLAQGQYRAAEEFIFAGVMPIQRRG